MADDELRRLERAWAESAAIEDFVRLQAERLRLGEIPAPKTSRWRLPEGVGRAVSLLYRHAGGVLDLGLSECPAEPTREDHRRAVLALFDSCDVPIESRDFGGKRISLREFVGWHYDQRLDCLALKGKSSAHLNDYFLAPYEERAECWCDYSTLEQQWDADLDLEEEPGFAHAFAWPPYGLRGDNGSINTLFRALCHVLFGGLADELEIFRWETGWTSYFDAGREWWGEYLWSVHRPGSAQIAVIAGSATD